MTAIDERAEPDLAPATTPTVDPVLMLAELMVRLRHVGVLVPSDPASLDVARPLMTELLVALGAQVREGELNAGDRLVLWCAGVVPRCGDGARSA